MGTTRADSLRHLEQELGVLIRRVRRVIGDRARAVHPDLQPAAYLMLAWLADEGPRRAADIAETFNLDKGAVSRQLGQLEGLGLVARTEDPDDRRAMRVVATDEAVRRLADVTAHRRKWLEERLGDWSADELEQLAGSLERYNRALGG